MAMHIRNPRTHDVVKQIAALTHQTHEEVVLSAVEEHLRTLAVDARVQQIIDDGAAIGRMAGLEPGVDPTADLYDESGLPR